MSMSVIECPAKVNSSVLLSDVRRLDGIGVAIEAGVT